MKELDRFKQIVYAVLIKQNEIVDNDNISSELALDKAIEEIHKKIKSDHNNLPTEFAFGVGTGISASILYDLEKTFANGVTDSRIDMNGPPPGSIPK